MDTLDLVDIQRTCYPNVNEFSYRSKTLGVKSRIDFFSKHLTKFVKIKKVDIQTSIAPDHNMIILSLSWPHKNPRGSGFWKFKNSLLEDKQYTTKILELYPQLRKKYHLCLLPLFIKFKSINQHPCQFFRSTVKLCLLERCKKQKPDELA